MAGGAGFRRWRRKGLTVEFHDRLRGEVQALRQALEAAQSENLELRRRLAPRHTARTEPS